MLMGSRLAQSRFGELPVPTHGTRASSACPLCSNGAGGPRGAGSTWAFADFPVGSRGWSGAMCCFLPLRATFLPAAWETGLGVPSLPRSWRAAQSDHPLLLTKGRSNCTKGFIAETGRRVPPFPHVLPSFHNWFSRTQHPVAGPSSLPPAGRASCSP